MPAFTVKELNAHIKAMGAEWVAADNHLKMSGDGKNAALGLALTPEMARAALMATRNSETVGMAAAAPPPPPPPKIDWRNNKGNFVTNVRDQGSCGSCVAFATVATLEARTLIKKKLPGGNLNLSEAHLFYCGTPNSCDVGWYPQHAFNFAATTGVGLEADFPYAPGNQPCRNVQAAVKAAGLSSAAKTLMRKIALQSGPVVGSFAVYEDFQYYHSGVYRHVMGNLIGYHAICVIGYDDANACWIVKNSWGKNWGDNGFFRIQYGECGLDTQYEFHFCDDVTVLPHAGI